MLKNIWILQHRFSLIFRRPLYIYIYILLRQFTKYKPSRPLPSGRWLYRLKRPVLVSLLFFFNYSVTIVIKDFIIITIICIWIFFLFLSFLYFTIFWAGYISMHFLMIILDVLYNGLNIFKVLIADVSYKISFIFNNFYWEVVF